MLKLIGQDLRSLGGDMRQSPYHFESYKSTSGADDTAALDDTIDADHLFPGGISRWIRVGGAGNLRVVDRYGVNRIIEGLVAGETIRVACVKIMSTGTTATKITVFF
jgi:hypothetical protein